MDLSAFIFVALAVAWAVYLIPKALKQHEDSAASRSIDGFSDRLRVLARREPDSASTARLVVRGTKPEHVAAVTVAVDVIPTPALQPTEPSAPEEPVVPLTPGQVRGRRTAAARAAKRRLRVVLAILLATAVVGLLVLLGQLLPVALLIPVAVLAAWLAACRLMVKSERASEVLSHRSSTASAPVEEAAALVGDDGPVTEEFAFVHVEADLVVPVEAAEPVAEPVAGSAQKPAAPRTGGWDPVPVTLPTYVGKEPAARRTVRTIDLDSTGVWTSGPLAADSELAREADEAERTAKVEAKDAADADRRRASGS